MQKFTTKDLCRKLTFGLIAVMLSSVLLTTVQAAEDAGVTATYTDLTITFREKLPPDAAFLDRYRLVVGHNHHIRGSNAAEAVITERLKKKCEELGVAALGVGSPWTDHCRINDYFQWRDRDYYYAEANPADHLDLERINDLLVRLNEGSKTYFYLDNETPKGRNGHLWYFGYTHLAPGWNDYSQDRPVQYYWNDPNIEINPRTGEPHRRRPYVEVVREQREAGGLGVWAHPTSWWRDEGKFITNIAAELPAHLLMDGGIDGLTVSGYDPFHKAYRAVYFQLLDRGYRIPAFGESDAFSYGFGDKVVIGNYLPFEDGDDSAAIAAKARSGNLYIGRGPAIALEIDSCLMGGTLEAKTGTKHRIRVHLRPAAGEETCNGLRLESNGGRVIAELRNCPAGIYEFDYLDDGSYRYIFASAFGAREGYDGRQQAAKNFSMTNPVYFMPANFDLPQPAVMRCTLRFRENSRFLGWKYDMGDGVQTIVPGERVMTVPAKLRLELTSPEGKKAIVYPFLEDAGVQRRISYLSEGGFLRDHPHLSAGDVPATAFDPELWKPCLERIVCEL